MILHRSHLWKVIAGSATVAIVFGLGLFMHRDIATASSPTAPQEPTAPFQGQFEGWNYLAAQDDDHISVLINYEKLTPEGIKAFAAANRKLVEQLRGPASVAVVFQRPLSIDEFKYLVQQSSLQVESYTMRAVDVTGTRITMQGAPIGRELVPQDMFNATLAHVQSQSSGVVFKGVITVDGTATPAQLKQLLTDERVFTTDITRTVAVENARAQIAARAANLKQLPIESRLVAPLYWFMEDTGVASK